MVPNNKIEMEYCLCNLILIQNSWPCRLQQLAEESTYRNELQMQLASKESDIEQLREKLSDLQQRVENSSVTSLQTDETDSNTAGRWMAIVQLRKYKSDF